MFEGFCFQVGDAYFEKKVIDSIENLKLCWQFLQKGLQKNKETVVYLMCLSWLFSHEQSLSKIRKGMKFLKINGNLDHNLA